MSKTYSLNPDWRSQADGEHDPDWVWCDLHAAWEPNPHPKKDSNETPS